MSFRADGTFRLAIPLVEYLVRYSLPRLGLNACLDTDLRRRQPVIPDRRVWVQLLNRKDWHFGYIGIASTISNCAFGRTAKIAVIELADITSSERGNDTF